MTLRRPLWKPFASRGALALLLGATGLQTWAAEGDRTVPDDARLGATRASLQATVDRAEAAGLPGRPLVIKVREGLAKGVPPERIAAAVESLERGLGGAGRI